MNTLFLQFYTIEPFDTIRLMNGFSDTWDYCKTKGDFIWVDVKKADSLELPFKKGRVFTSIFFTDLLYSVYKLAKRYPDVEFVCGGPVIESFEAILDELFRSKIDIPNLQLTNKTVEDYFNIPNFSYKWNLNLDGIKDIGYYDYLTYTYQINSKCYWNKCTFCSYPKFKARKREDINLECLDKVEFDGKQQIKLNIPSLTNNCIDKIFSQLKKHDDIVYELYLRCSYSETKCLDSALKQFRNNLPRIKFRLGIEFPSDDMLKFMNKGITLHSILETIKMLEKYDNEFIHMYLLFINSWPNLVKNHLTEFNTFKNIITKPVEAIVLSPLFCAAGTEVHETFKDQVKEYIYSGPFYKGYEPKISDGVKAIDRYMMHTLKNKTKKLYALFLNFSEAKELPYKVYREGGGL